MTGAGDPDRASAPRLSVFLIARDEADRLPETLAALAPLRALPVEIVLVDSGSSDGTAAVAEIAGARVATRAFDGYGPQKRFAETLCRAPWLLNLDADEVLTPALAREIAALFSSGDPPLDAYEIAIAEVFPGEATAHRFAYRLHPVRLYRRSHGTYAASTVHDRVELRPGARVGRLKGTIDHRSVRSLGEQLDKLNAYAEAQADDLDARGRRLPAWRLYLEFPLAFLKAYVGRRHALRGAYGFMTAMNHAFYRYLRLAKHLERRLGRDRRAASSGGANTSGGADLAGGAEPAAGSEVPPGRRS